MTTEHRHSLKKIFWDYNISDETLFNILAGEQHHAVVTREKIFSRMLERLGWHEILGVVGIEQVKLLLTKEVIQTLRQAELRERYEFIRKILCGETVSFTGWGDEYYQQIKHTLFSNRWYRSQQALF